MRTLAALYGNLGQGGVQRGASFQVPMFARMGIRVVVLTGGASGKDDFDVPGAFAKVCLGLGEDRGRRLRDALRKYDVDLLIHHDAYDRERLQTDLDVAEETSVPVVIFWHSVFSHLYLRPNRQRDANPILALCKRARAMITLTRTDEAFFRLLGIPALSIPYSDPDLMDGFIRKAFPHRILWMGRLKELKRPLDAIRVLAKVCERIPDFELFLLGDGDVAVREELERFVRERGNLVERVHFEGFVRNVRSYLESCGVGLVTSRFEGCCHAAVEIKMASLPLVTYSMPYADWQDAGSGALVVPQGDVDAAAAAIVDLFSSDGELSRQGQLARESYLRLSSVDQDVAYRRLFGLLERATCAELLEVDPVFASRAMQTLTDHIAEALRIQANRIVAERAASGDRLSSARCVLRKIKGKLKRAFGK